MNNSSNNIIVTGSVGFIGASLCVKLLERGENVMGIDNHNDYYDPSIKEARLKRLIRYSNYYHYWDSGSFTHGLLNHQLLIFCGLPVSQVSEGLFSVLE